MAPAPVEAAGGILEWADVAAAFAELGNVMLATAGVEGLLEDVARQGAAVIASPVSCGITLAGPWTADGRHQRRAGGAGR